MSDSLRPHELQATRLLCPLNSSGKNTGVGWRSLLQGIFQTQGSNPVSFAGRFFTVWATREAPRSSPSPLLLQFKQLLFPIYLPPLRSLSPESSIPVLFRCMLSPKLKDLLHFLSPKKILPPFHLTDVWLNNGGWWGPAWMLALALPDYVTVGPTLSSPEPVSSWIKEGSLRSLLCRPWSELVPLWEQTRWDAELRRGPGACLHKS